MEAPFFVAAQVSTVAYFVSTLLFFPVEFELDLIVVRFVLCYYPIA